MAPTSRHSSPLGNHLLDAMSPAALQRLQPQLEPIRLEAQQTIHEPGAPARYALFPTQGMISVVAMMENGTSVEIGKVGREGMYNVSSILGDDTPTQRALVQLVGSAFRIEVRALREAALADAQMLALLLRYAQVTLTTAVQSAACNRLHLLEQRCARWLLAAHDRARTDTFAMTHEFLAMMLGVRRPGVTIAAQSLQADGLITYNHGTVTILDRAGLEAVSCECYAVLQSEFRRLLGPEC
jgi:CRP-like cAMP-binding protein